MNPGKMAFIVPAALSCLPCKPSWFRWETVGRSDKLRCCRKFLKPRVPAQG